MEEAELTIEFCNVVQVEWNNGVAYRKAPGSVVKKLWEK